ncbi:hypothetical protein ACMFMG_011714 [Clarireedia jacksonii]
MCSFIGPEGLAKGGYWDSQNYDRNLSAWEISYKADGWIGNQLGSAGIEPVDINYAVPNKIFEQPNDAFMANSLGDMTASISDILPAENLLEPGYFTETGDIGFTEHPQNYSVEGTLTNVHSEYSALDFMPNHYLYEIDSSDLEVARDVYDTWIQIRKDTTEADTDGQEFEEAATDAQGLIETTATDRLQLQMEEEERIQLCNEQGKISKVVEKKDQREHNTPAKNSKQPAVLVSRRIPSPDTENNWEEAADGISIDKNKSDLEQLYKLPSVPLDMATVPPINSPIKSCSNSLDEGNSFTGPRLKRPRRKYGEIERPYKCSWEGCKKAYGNLGHLNTHVGNQSHGVKRKLLEEFTKTRKEWRARQHQEALSSTTNGSQFRCYPSYPKTDGSTVTDLSLSGAQPFETSL